MVVLHRFYCIYIRYQLVNFRMSVLCTTFVNKSIIEMMIDHKVGPGRVAQSVACLATDVGLTADPGAASLLPDRSHTFMEIDHEIISTVILLPSAESFKKGCCQLPPKVCSRSTA